MKNETLRIFNELFRRYPCLNCIKKEILQAYDLLIKTIYEKKKIIICGNGGSAADSEHIVGELMKSFRKKRPIDKEIYSKLSAFGAEGEKLQNSLEGVIRAVSLTSHISLSTAFANDREPSAVFAQQLYGIADVGDVLIAISTSGNSENCVLAATLAKVTGVTVIAMTGEEESRLSRLSDIPIEVPETETYKIQELHLPIYHCLCAMIEEEIF